MCAAVVALIVAGGTLEVIGIGLIAWQIRRDRRRADRLVHRDQVVYIGPGIEHERALGGLTVTGGRKPTTEERLESLEHQVLDFRESLEGAKQDLRRELRADIESAEQRAGLRLGSETGDLRDALVEILTGSLSERRLGVTVLLAGVVVSTVANVWALASC